MFSRQDFLSCIAGHVAAGRLSETGKKQAADQFERIRDSFVAAGHAPLDAASRAQERVVREITEQIFEKRKRDIAAGMAQVEGFARLDQAKDAKVGWRGVAGLDKTASQEGVALAQAATSLLEANPKFGGVNVASQQELERGFLKTFFEDTFEQLGKGVFGIQKGAVHLEAIAREMFGEASGDGVAAAMAQAFKKAGSIGIDRLNAAGASMRKLADYTLGDPSTAVRMHGKKAQWVEDFMEATDWNRTTYKDGSLVGPDVDKRRKFLEEAFDTKYQDGANHLIEGAMRQRGAAMGNQLEKSRLLHIKDADAWLRLQEKYGEGNIVDFMMRHLDRIADTTGAVRVLGPNPEITLQAVKAEGMRRAAALDVRAKQSFEAYWHNYTDEITKLAFKRNPMDPESVLATGVHSLSSWLISTQLGSAMLASFGDFGTKAIVKNYHKLDGFGGMGHYLDAISSDKDAKKLALSSGFVWDSVFKSMYVNERFMGAAQYGPKITRHLADGVMRASGLAQHTTGVKHAAMLETMAAFAKHKNDAFADLPFREMFERAGITEREWDVLRASKAFSPKEGVELLRPIDLAGTKHDAVFQKMQGFLLDLRRQMVIETSWESQVRLRGTSRPDTLPGAILHSFSMYKSYPITFFLTYGRLAMANPDAQSRMMLLAGLAGSMTVFGALGVQLKEIAAGRDPRPMGDPAFWGKALMAGGALGLYGDFFFSGVNEMGRGPVELMAGPLGGFAKDVQTLAFGDAQKLIESDFDFAGHDSTFAAKAAEFVRRVTPGTNLWPSKLLVERQLWDRIQELADPDAYRKQRLRAKKQEDTFGNEYFWAPGDRMPERGPSFGGP